MIEIVCLAGGFAFGWCIAKHRARLAHQEANADIISAWISFRRPDVPPIVPYRSSPLASEEDKP